jgi:hypothetical protein
MVRIAITAAAYDAIASTLPEDALRRSGSAGILHPRRGGRPRPSEVGAGRALDSLQLEDFSRMPTTAVR